MEPQQEQGQSPDARFDVNHALVVGVDTYGHGIPPLATAVEDATAVARLLSTRHRFQVDPLIGDAAIGPALLDRLAALGRTLTADSRLILYFACHGISQPSDGVRPDGFLLLADAVDGDRSTYVAMRELYRRLALLPCRHVLVVLDCCFAGMFAGARDLGGPVPVYRERYDHFVESPAWQVLASAAKDQRAFDVLPERELGRDGHSPFAGAFLDALEGAGDLDGDGLVTATELYWYVRNRVERRERHASFRQTPNLAPLDHHEHGEFVFQVADALRLVPAPVLDHDTNPYRGRVPFRERDAACLFGRAAEIADLVAKATTLRLAVVTGASGAGKSSLVNAGLVPAVRTLAGWQLVQLDARADDVTAWQPTGEARTLVVIDHVEDALAGAGPAFARQLAAILRGRASIHVVLVMRSDAEAALRSGPLAPWWNAGRVALHTPGRAALREIVTQPARDVVMVFEPDGLVDALVDEVVTLPAPLPVLSAALAALYHHYWMRQRAAPDPHDRALRATDHPGAARVVDALAAASTALTVDEAVIVAGLLPHLFDLDEDGQVRPRRIRLDELRGGLGGEVRMRIVERWVRDWLLVVGTDARGVYVEPQHGVLMRRWNAAARVSTAEVALLQALDRAAREWRETGGRDHALLWDDEADRLDRVETLAALSPKLITSERAFVRASSRRRRRGRLVRGAVVGALAAVVIAAVAGVISLRQAERASRIAKAGEHFQAARSHLAAREHASATQAALAAVATAPDDDPMLASYVPFAMDLLSRSPAIVARLPGAADLRLAAIHPDGTRVVAIAGGALPHVWVGGPAWHEVTLRTTGPAGDLDALAWSPDGRAIAASLTVGEAPHDEQVLAVWDLEGNQRLRYPIPAVGGAPCGATAVGWCGEGCLAYVKSCRRERVVNEARTLVPAAEEIVVLDLGRGDARTVATLGVRDDTVVLGPRFAAVAGTGDVRVIPLGAETAGAAPVAPVSARGLAFSSSGDRVYLITHTFDGRRLEQRRMPDLGPIGTPAILSSWLNADLDADVSVRVAPDATRPDVELVLVSGGSSRTAVYLATGGELHLVGRADGAVDLLPVGDTLVVHDRGVRPPVVRSLGWSPDGWYVRSIDRPLPERWVGRAVVPAGILGVGRDGTVELVAAEPAPDEAVAHPIGRVLERAWFARDGGLVVPDVPSSARWGRVADGGGWWHQAPAPVAETALAPPASFTCLGRQPPRSQVVIRRTDDAAVIGTAPWPAPDLGEVAVAAIGRARACYAFAPTDPDAGRALRCIDHDASRCPTVALDAAAELIALTADERFATFLTVMGIGVVALDAGAGVPTERWYEQPTSGSGRRFFTAALAGARSLTAVVDPERPGTLASLTIHLAAGSIRVTPETQAIRAGTSWLPLDLERLPAFDDVRAISDDARLAAVDGELAPSGSTSTASPGRATTVFDLATGMTVMVQPYDEYPVAVRITDDALVTLSPDGVERRWAMPRSTAHPAWRDALARTGRDGAPGTSSAR